MKNKSFENTHSEVLDYLAKHKFTISAFGKTGNSIRIDDKTFTIKDQIAIEKIHPKIHISGSSNSYVWYIFMPEKYAKGGGIYESEIDELYKKSKFINDDFNWKLKLLEMLQDNSIDAYNIYQTLTKEQKEQVLQEQYEVDNDMGSDGDGKIKTTKENLKILLNGAKNGKKYAKGGSVERENAEMVLNNNKQISHHTKELASAVKGKKVPAWVVAKVNRSASDLSDATHYLDGSKYKKGGGVGELKYPIIINNHQTSLKLTFKEVEKFAINNDLILVDFNDFPSGIRFFEITFEKLKNKIDNKKWFRQEIYLNKYTKNGDFDNSAVKLKFAKGSTIKGNSNYRKFGAENSRLAKFNIDDLDDFESMQYNQFSKSMDKASALQILINNVEGDYSQLNEQLSEIAEEQFPSDEFFEDNRQYKKGGAIKGFCYTIGGL